MFIPRWFLLLLIRVSYSHFCVFESTVILFIHCLIHSDVVSHKSNQDLNQFNSVWLPLVDVVEYCVVFAPKVFVQSFGVSCHCGPHSTVVHSRVCHCSRGDLQMHFGFIITHVEGQSRDSIRYWRSCSRVRNKELWWFSWILSIPEESITTSCLFGVCVGQSNSAVF